MGTNKSRHHGLVLLPALLIALLIVLTVSIVLEPAPSLAKWLMMTLPSAPVLYYLMLQRRRSLQWLGFLVLFYFINGVLQLFQTLLVQQALGLLTVLCCLVIFVTVIVTLRTNTGKRNTVHEQLE